MLSSISTFSCHNFCVIKSNLYWAVTQMECQIDYSIQVDSLKQVSPNWRIKKNQTLLPYNWPLKILKFAQMCCLYWFREKNVVQILLKEYSQFYMSGSVTCDRLAQVEISTKRLLILKKGWQQPFNGSDHLIEMKIAVTKRKIRHFDNRPLNTWWPQNTVPLNAGWAKNMKT